MKFLLPGISNFYEAEPRRRPIVTVRIAPDAPRPEFYFPDRESRTIPARRSDTRDRYRATYRKVLPARDRGCPPRLRASPLQPAMESPWRPRAVRGAAADMPAMPDIP